MVPGKTSPNVRVLSVSTSPGASAALEDDGLINARIKEENPAFSVLMQVVLIPAILLLVAGCASPETVAGGEGTGVQSAQNSETAGDIYEGNRSSEMPVEQYERAARFLSWNLNRYIEREPGHVNWMDDETFWYREEMPEGHRFFLVDPELGTKSPAFDHERLAEAIGREAQMELSAHTLPFRFFRYLEDRRNIRFSFQGTSWLCDIEDYYCPVREDLPESVPNSVNSPDGRYAAFIRDDNLWVYDRADSSEIRLTEDGEKYYGYATDSQGWTRSDNPILKWSPDSRRIATFQQDERGVGKMPLVPTETGRPGLDLWPYAVPGDTVVPMLERVVIDVEKRDVVRLQVEPSHQRASNCCGLIRNRRWVDVEWSDDGEHLAFVSTSRDYSTVTLYDADPVSGEVAEVYTEIDEPFFESNLVSRGMPNWTVLHESGEFIWFSRADNWGHLYLHDLVTGEKKNRITTGEWNVVDIMNIDEKNRTLLITGVGKERGRDPYFTHLYRVGFDGGGLELLTVEDGNHEVSASPAGSYFTTTWSRPDVAPVMQLKRADGKDIMELGRMKTGRLEELGFRPPEPFSVKARDGSTDIYGLLVKPSDFDSEKSYPIVNSIYPGPQIGSVGTRSFSTHRRGQAHALAELGFVVVMVDGFGTPFRSREFHTYWHADMGDNGLEDQVAAMEQLADRHEWIDLDRAGIYGHSGGGYAAAAALFRFPDFFKAGVSSAGNHDNRSYTYYWGEKYHGMLEKKDGRDTYTNQANHLDVENLRGNLLISYGTMDSNVHPNMTLQVVDMLIQYNKDFDLMVYPNRNHSYVNEPYNIRLTWDYFVRHLLNKEPPAEFDLRNR